MIIDFVTFTADLSIGDIKRPNVVKIIITDKSSGKTEENYFYISRQKFRTIFTLISMEQINCLMETLRSEYCDTLVK